MVEDSRRKVVGFGEIMMRLSTPNFQRFAQTRSFNVTYAGSEANVMIALSNLGISTEFVTRLPDNDLGDACINYLRQFGVGVDKIIRGGDRLGVYFLEIGAAHRPSKVIYDRANSAFATIEPHMLDWEKIFSDACWFHWSGITPAVSEGAAKTCLEGVKKAKEMGLTVSCDINYRAKLWRWGKTAREVLSELLNYVDVLIGGRGDFERVFGVKIEEMALEECKGVIEELMRTFQSVKTVAVSLRKSISSSHNTLMGIIYDGSKLYRSRTYDIIPIIDRVGSGDSFAAGIIYGLLEFRDDLQHVIDFATAASCLKHTIPGDSCILRVEEVEELVGGVISGGIIR